MSPFFILLVLKPKVVKAILTILLLLFAHSLFSQSTFIEGRGVTSQGLWSENTAGISCISQNTFGISVENRFGLSDLSYAQCRVAIPNTYGVVQGHWNNSGNESYAINDWGISLRYLLFDTPSFSSRIYAYEPDVMYSFSVPFHYGEGQRISTVFKYKLQKMTLNIKLGQTLFYDNTQVKSGSVEGHKSTEVKLVLKWIL